MTARDSALILYYAVALFGLDFGTLLDLELSVLRAPRARSPVLGDDHS